MIIRKSYFVGALIALAGVAVHAESADKTPGSGPNPYTDCGIGAALFSETHWAAVTSNVIWDLGITAITSATVSPQTCSGKKVATALFIRDTYEQLMEETARGQGEHLATVMELFDCHGGSQSGAIAATREAMGQAVSQPGYSNMPRLDKAAQFYGTVQSIAAKGCAA